MEKNSHKGSETETLRLGFGDMISLLEDVIDFMKDCDKRVSKEGLVTDDEIVFLDTNKKFFANNGVHVFDYERALKYKKDLAILDIYDAELDIVKSALLNIMNRMEDFYQKG